MDDLLKQRNELHHRYERLQEEDRAMRDEVSAGERSHFYIHMFSFTSKIKSKDEISRDLKLALTSSNNDAQTVYSQLRQLNSNLSELEEKYQRDITLRNQQIDDLRLERKQIIVRIDQWISIRE